MSARFFGFTNAYLLECAKYISRRRIAAYSGVALMLSILASSFIYWVDIETSLLQVATVGDKLAFVVVNSSFAPVVSFVFGAYVGSYEFRHGNLALTLVRVQTRPLVLLAKAALAAQAGIFLGAISLSALGATACITGSLGDLALTGNGLVLLLVSHLMISALWAIIGLQIGVASKSLLVPLLGISITTLVIEAGLRSTLTNGSEIIRFIVNLFPRTATVRAHLNLSRESLLFDSQIGHNMMHAGFLTLISYLIVFGILANRRIKTMEL